MRKLIYAINVTLDGCCDHTKMIVDEEVLEHYSHLQEFGLIVYGRKTYQLMVPYWPDVAKDPSSSKADKKFADAFVASHKVVFSRSLPLNSAEVKKAEVNKPEVNNEDTNTRIVHTDLREEILKLKQQPGKDILVGGVSIPSQLIEMGLVDEYRFAIMPVIAGEGTRLMEGINLPEKLQLKLVESKLFKSGCVALRYLKN